MDPISATLLAVTVAGAGVAMAGSVQQAKATEAAAEANAKMIREQASEEEARVRRINRIELGRYRASVAKSGVQLAGSPLEQIVRAAGELERNALGARRGLQVAHNELVAGRATSRAQLIGGVGSGLMAIAGAGAQSYRPKPPSTASQPKV